MRWVFQEPDKKLVEKLQSEFDTSAAIAVTMANRGIHQGIHPEIFLNLN